MKLKIFTLSKFRKSNLLLIYGLNGGTIYFFANLSQSISSKKGCSLSSLASLSEFPNLLLG